MLSDPKALESWQKKRQKGAKDTRRKQGRAAYSNAYSSSYGNAYSSSYSSGSSNPYGDAYGSAYGSSYSSGFSSAYGDAYGSSQRSSERPFAPDVVILDRNPWRRGRTPGGDVVILDVNPWRREHIRAPPPQWPSWGKPSRGTHR